MKNSCKHPIDDVLKAGSEIEWYSNWQWCQECGAIRLILTSMFGNRFKKNNPNLYNWNIPKLIKQTKS